MPSERRLHPLSFVFVIGGQIRQLVVPGLVVLIGAGSAGLDWQAWVMVFVIPYALVALLRTLSFRYRFDAGELVITTGFVFRNERHVPYGRIQNIDAVQHILHRLLRVVDVRVETGGGDEPEARMRVLPIAALEEMRERVRAGRVRAGQPGGESVSAAGAIPVAPERRELLTLGPRELLLAGFIDSRGLIIIGAAFGLLWEVGLFDPTLNLVFGENDVEATGRGLARQVVRALLGGEAPSPGRMAILVLAFAAFVLVIRVLSMCWSLIRLWGFRIDRRGDDLSAGFGLFTRVMATIPIRRIQTVTVRESPLHRLFDTASIRVDSAGGDVGEGGAGKRESLAPIIRRVDLTHVLAEVLPDVEIAHAAWSPVDPGGFRRALKVSLAFAVFFTMPFTLMLEWWTLAWFGMLVIWAVVHSKLYVSHLRWAVGDQAVLFRSGYIWRELTVARFNKIQAVTLSESPFDRRARMASVRVDTAGAGDASHRVDIPYLARRVADELYRRLAGEAARTAFRW